MEQIFSTQGRKKKKKGKRERERERDNSSSLISSGPFWKSLIQPNAITNPKSTPFYYHHDQMGIIDIQLFHAIKQNEDKEKRREIEMSGGCTKAV